MRSYSSLISDYKPDFFYFELVDFFRKATFTGALLFAEQGSVEQLFIGTFLAMAFFLLQVVASPFKRAAHNWLKQVELLCLLATFQVCLIIHVGQGTTKASYDYFLVFTVLVMLAIFFGSTALAVWRSKLLRVQIGAIDATGLLDESSIRQGAAMREQEWQARMASELAASERRASQQLDVSSEHSSSDSAKSSLSFVDSAAQKQRKQATEKRNAAALEHRRMREARGMDGSADSN